MHRYFSRILQQNPNIDIPSVVDDLAAVEATSRASRNGFLERFDQRDKTIELDFPYETQQPHQFLQLFQTIDRDISNEGFSVWFRNTIELPGRFRAQAFFLNVYIANDVSVRDVIVFGNANDSVGLEAQPREIALFYFGLKLWSKRRERLREQRDTNVFAELEEGLYEELEELMHVLFPYRSNLWVESMMTARFAYEDTVTAILASIHNNGLIKAIFQFLVSTSEEVGFYEYEIV